MGQRIGRSTRRVSAERAGLVRGRTHFWEYLGRWIFLAGGLYPLVVYGLWGVVGFLLGALSLLTGGALDALGAGVAFLITGLLAGLVFFLVGAFWAGLVSTVVVPFSAMATHVLRWPAHHDTAGKLTGGLVAYIATLPAALGASLWATDTFDFLPALFVFAHCGLAIAMGQAAGCLAAVTDLRRRYRGRLKSSGLRFGVWQLLALTVPVAVVLSVLKLADLLNPPMALASIAAAFCAVATWQPVTWLVNRWLDRRLAKRRERRLAECSTWNNLPS